MHLEFYHSDKLKKEIKKIIGKYLDLNAYRIFFFGSRVKGDNFPCSDIDIGIEGKEEIPPEAKFKIEEELENLPILYKIEVVDFKHVSEDFRREALKFVEYVK